MARNGQQKQVGLSTLFLFLFSLIASVMAATGIRAEGLPWDDILGDGGPILLVVEAKSGRILQANRAAEKFYGLSETQLAQMHIRELDACPPELLAAAGPPLLKDGQEHLIFPQRLADGTIRTVKAVPSFSKDGALLFYLLNDVTEEERLKSQLQANMERLHRAEAIANVGSWEFVFSERIVLLSEGARRVLGWPSGEQTMQDTYDHTLREDRQIRSQALRDLVEKGKPYDIIFRVRRATDDAILTIHSVAEYNRETDTVFGTLADISELVLRNEEYLALRRRNTYLLSGLLLIQFGVIIALVINRRRRKQAEKELQQNLKRNESLVRILQHGAASTQELIDYALQESIRLTGSEAGYFYFYAEDKQEFTLNTWKNDLSQKQGEDKEAVFPLDQAEIWGEAVKTGRPVIINEFKEHKNCPIQQIAWRNCLAVPIFDGPKIVAVAALVNKKSDYKAMDIWQATLLWGSVWATVERRRGETALREEKERLQATLLSVGDGVIATDELGRIEIINEVAENLTGWPHKEALGRPFTDVFKTVNEKTGGPSADPIARLLATGKVAAVATPTLLLGRQGGKRHIAERATPIRNGAGQITGAVLVFRDVSAERKRLAEIEYLSHRDHLTGLYNRRYFEEKIKELDTAANLPLSVIVADLDGLKIANDSFGHLLGDQILRRAAQIIKENCQSGQVVARWGGDEFVLLLPATNQEEAEKMALRIGAAFQNEKVDSVPISISVGWSTKTGVSQDLGQAFKKAEDHMYRAKILQSPGIRSDVIQALMAALYEKDPREEQHCQRVSKLSVLVGKAMGLSPRQVQELKIAGLFHDIGKVSVAEHVLNKAGPLTGAEWKEIKRHPEVGYRVLGNVKDMAEIANYVLAHHERWDGQGYPRGLSAEEIPLQARIIAAADAYDAMVSYRPYKQSLTKSEAVAELQKWAGRQFDPRVVEAFLRVINNWDEMAAAH